MSELPPTPPAQRIEPVVIEDEMRSSYLDYAMSVIVGRALPDVRDGLKPVHRRILYSMDEGGLRPDRPYRKCASAVGDVMKKYHPHGDTAIYDALVRMGQDFSTRNLLIDGHGNFGSIDGDPPAAMRYTEARLTPLAMELLRGIDEDTVDHVDNYDGYEEEPVVLPARFPNLLANGATGIAVGMATNIPPHNLRELIDATIALIADPDLTAVDLMEYVPAPDFPTGGRILGRSGAFEAYTTGRGSVRMRATCEIEDDPDRADRQRIVVTEIPYMVNKSTLLEKVARLANDRVVPGIVDLRDESSGRSGLRIVIELGRGANAQVVLNQLFKHSQLQDSFGVNLIALVDGVPKTLTLDQALRHYVAHQVDVIERRTAHRLDRAERHAHILQGQLVALEHLDEVIGLIRAAASADEARTQLMTRFELTDRQSRAILDLQLRRLAALERQRIVDEYEELQATIEDLRDILADPERVKAIVVEELSEIREEYGDDRRSLVVPDDGDMTVEDLIPDQTVAIALTRSGYVKRVPVSEFRAQRRGGRGVRAADMREDDVVQTLLTCGVKDHLLFFTNHGRSYRIKAYQVPERSRSAKGVYVANVPGLAFEADEQVAAILKLQTLEGDGRHLVFATREGRVKRTPLSAFDSPYSTLIAISLRDHDELIGVRVSDGGQHVVLVSSGGRAIRFSEDDARAMGRTASGVTGMRLRPGEHVLSLGLAPSLPDGEVPDGGVPDGEGPDGEVPAELPDADPDALDAEDLSGLDPDRAYLLTVSERGIGKRTPIEEYRRQGRGGLGIRTAVLDEDTGELAGALMVPYEAELLLITDAGVVIRIPVADVRVSGRATKGVWLMRPDEGTTVVGVTLVVDEADDVVDEGEVATAGPAGEVLLADPGDDGSVGEPGRPADES